MYRYTEMGSIVREDGAIIPIDETNRDYRTVMKWVAAGNVIAPYTPPALSAQMVKAEARRRILERFPDWKQTNMIARGVELQDVWRRNGLWTVEEHIEADKLTVAWDWIKAIRRKSDELEQLNPIPQDYADDKYWV